MMGSVPIVREDYATATYKVNGRDVTVPIEVAGDSITGQVVRPAPVSDTQEEQVANHEEEKQ